MGLNVLESFARKILGNRAAATPKELLDLHVHCSRQFLIAARAPRHLRSFSQDVPFSTFFLSFTKACTPPFTGRLTALEFEVWVLPRRVKFVFTSSSQKVNF